METRMEDTLKQDAKMERETLLDTVKRDAKMARDMMEKDAKMKEDEGHNDTRPGGERTSKEDTMIQRRKTLRCRV